MLATPRTQALVQLFGVLAGFLVAVIAGHQAAGFSKPSKFQRFHQQISPDAAFYPPFSMLENLALARWQPGQTVVLIGGNSVFNGVGQPLSELWSVRLQELLGPRFAVVNLSFRGAYASEGAALTAESLLRRGVPVIYVTNAGPGPMARPYESTYAYLFWDGLAQHQLLDNPARSRELQLRERVLPPVIADDMKAKQLNGRLNARLRFQDLWHHVGYRQFFTVWSYVTRENFLRPKDRWADFEPPAPPVGDRFQTLFATEMQITRGLGASLMETDGADGWRPVEPILQQTGLDVDEIFAPQLKARMLVVLVRNCPYYLSRLTPAEQDRDRATYAAYETLWQSHGINCVVAGSDFAADDYFDRVHLIGSGGRKLAQVVAAALRPMAP
jgi:hypothetical protein